MWFILWYLAHTVTVSYCSLTFDGEALMDTLNELFAINKQPIRQTTHGSIVGYYQQVNDTVAEIYEGVPYAEAPIGKLRFEVPMPLSPWNGTRDCGPGKMVRCLQFRRDAKTVEGAEDCLFLKIFIPGNQPQNVKRFPMFIWLHGGSFETSGTQIPSNEAIIGNFVANNIVFVMINYRLGPIGFLSGGHRQLHGNFGLDDQLAAIRWLKINGPFLDAHPNNVVLGGVGAGAACASLLALSPKSKGLFNGLILRSGSVLSPWAVRSAITQIQSARLVDLTNCSYNSLLGMKHTVDCLKKLSVNRIFSAWKRVVNEQHYENDLITNTYFTPVVDTFRIEESILPGEPMSLMTTNLRVPLLIGVTSAECANIIRQFNGSTDRYTREGDWNLNKFVPPHLYTNHKQVQKLTELHYLSNYPEALSESERRNILAQITADQCYNAPAAHEAMLYARQQIIVYAYIFDPENFTQSTVTPDGGKYSASHGTDCALIFNKPVQLLDDPERLLGERTLMHMVDFIHKRSMEDSNFERFTELHPVAMHTGTGDLVDFFSNATQFWHQTIGGIQQLHLETYKLELEPQHYRVLLQPCTIGSTPYKVPFYILLITLAILTTVSLSVFAHRQRVRQKPTYTIVHELQAPTTQ